MLVLCLTAVAGSTVRITDAASLRPVVLVGTMHYNPHSVDAVDAALRDAADTKGLHATAIELCLTRCPAAWRSRDSQGIARMLCDDEFSRSYEVTIDCGLPDVALVDQPIEQTVRRLGTTLQDTAIDVFTPGGWQRIAADLTVASTQFAAFSAASLDGRMLAGMPLALCRYVYQSPAALPLLVLSAAALAAAIAIDDATGAAPAWGDGAFALVLAVTLGRAVFVALIDERNRVLAANIRQICLSGQGDAEDPPSAAVVAVIGLAHLDGVRAALLRDDDESGCEHRHVEDARRPLYPAVRETEGDRWVARWGSGHPHPGGDGCSFEEHRRRLTRERYTEADRRYHVGEPLLRSLEWTRDADSAYRSSTWSNDYSGLCTPTGCLRTQARSRFCTLDGSFRNGQPLDPFGEWLLFDLQTVVGVAKMRLVAYWSDEDSFGCRELTVESAASLAGPFEPVASYVGLPRSAEAKAVDLYLDGSARFWRVRCTRSHGGGAFGIYGIDFWRRRMDGDEAEATS